MVVAGLTTLLSATFTSPAFARTYEFIFGNYTGQQLVELYWRPATVEEGGWGFNFLTGRTLSADELVRLIIDDDASPLNPDDENAIYQNDCLFDIRGVFADGNELEDYSINLCEISTSTGFFDFVDTEAFYEEGGKEIFVSNLANFSLIELAFENPNTETFFVFGENFKSELQSLGESPKLSPLETGLFLINLPESECKFTVIPRFLDEATGEILEPVSRSVDFCSNYDEIRLSENRISLRNFEKLPITVNNDTPYRIVTLEVAPSFRSALWSDVVQGDFVGPYSEKNLA
ncbi:MAG: hypothetical protein F6K11_33490, partial [Leptolyngbya sp. SIO3F4]|nr:hypothetical protein [Leptolyngbya sp. SIO3F4]